MILHYACLFFLILEHSMFAELLTAMQHTKKLYFLSKSIILHFSLYNNQLICHCALKLLLYFDFVNIFRLPKQTGEPKERIDIRGVHR